MAKRRTKRTYDDQFRASAVVMLKSQGYPEMKGALEHVAKHLHVPSSTLQGWFNGTSNPPPPNIRDIKTKDLRTLYLDEIYEIFNVLPGKRNEATYGTLATAQGIFFDKIRLLDGLPTEIVQVLPNLLQALADIELDAVGVFNDMIAKAHAERERMNAHG